MLQSMPVSRRRLALGAAMLTTLAGATIAATAPGTAQSANAARARTIVVQPTAAGPALLVHGVPVAPGSAALPANFGGPAACDHGPAPAPWAMVIKGRDGAPSYSVACASPAATTARATFAEALASLQTVRAMVAAQKAGAGFGERDRADALGAIDVSIAELRQDLAREG